jgi:hypothetical protein
LPIGECAGGPESADGSARSAAPTSQELHPNKASPWKVHVMVYLAV